GFTLGLSDELGALEVDSETDFVQPGLPHRAPEPPSILSVEHQKPAPAGPDQLSTQRAVAPCQLVPFVDPLVAHQVRALALVFPIDVDELCDGSEVTGFYVPVGFLSKR